MVDKTWVVTVRYDEKYGLYKWEACRDNRADWRVSGGTARYFTRRGAVREAKRGVRKFIKQRNRQATTTVELDEYGYE